jgi:hypothetical protein
MWELHQPKPVKLIIGILAADEAALAAAVKAISKSFGVIDLTSDVWPFTQTNYYKDELGPNALRQFVSIEKLIDPGQLAQIKHDTNSLEQQLAKELGGVNPTRREASCALQLPRPVNLDPGFIEPSKLILASTKNFSHRIYIGNKMYAEVTLMYEKGGWRHFEFTFPDYKQSCYQDFLTKVRTRLMEQLKT